MTTRPDPDLSDRDPRFDAAWRSVSSEAPPAALDTAILAAAHREAGARPQRVDDHVREATRPERWWFPLAAAATIGAIALGLLQIVGTDPITMVVSDMPPGTTPVAREAAAKPSPAPAAAIDANPATEIIAPLPTAPGPSRAQRAERARSEPKVARSESVAPEAPTSVTDSAASTPGTGASPPREALRTEIPTAVGRAAGAPAPRAAMPPRSPEPAALMGAAKLAAPAIDRATMDTARDRRDAGTALPVAEWIALIRKLRDEGRDDEAAKELTAFRNLHPDHEQLLPSDLSRWQLGAK
jgi:hypothetical protein